MLELALELARRALAFSHHHLKGTRRRLELRCIEPLRNAALLVPELAAAEVLRIPSSATT